MFRYYLHLAIRTLRRNVVLTALAVTSIGVGIGASMAMLTILRAASGDPIPQKSAQLFVPQIDNWGPIPNEPPGSRTQLPPDLTYRDAAALMRAHVAPRQAAMYPTALTITLPGTQGLPLQGHALATDSDFFPMFDVPFQYGGPWSHIEDATHAAVVVLTQQFNDRVFGGPDSVGRTLTIGKKPYRVIGVLAAWHPSPRFYDLSGGDFSVSEQLFLPFTRAIDENMQNDFYLSCGPRGNPGKGWSGLLQSGCNWIQVWVYLPTARDVSKYRAFLKNYAATQRRNGRFNWPTDVALRDVMQWLSYNHVVPAAVSTLTYVSFAILLVCIFNATGLLLAKFMARAPSIGVRRTLGATRGAVLSQCLVEAGLIGLLGGLVGVGLTKVGLMGCRAVLAGSLSILTPLRMSDVLIALVVAILATIFAGLYPAWRAIRVQPGARLGTRNQAGAALIGLQLALTLAVLCNALFIIRQQSALSRAPSGVRDEANVFTINNQWVGKSAGLTERVETDLSALRALPQVADATISEVHPLGGGLSLFGITLHPGDPKSAWGGMVYMADDHAISTLGLKLIAGRNFRPDEIVPIHGIGNLAPSLGGVIVTQALARKLAPHGDALGHMATLEPGGTHAPIIGVVARLQSSPIFGNSSLANDSMLLPYLDSDTEGYYWVRAKAGQLAAAMKSSRKALDKISRERIILGMKSLADWRRESYRSARGVALIMEVISALLLAVTAFGIVGLTNYWVTQRTRQIGVRRALGATRGAIARYFQTENLVITVIGSVLGVLLALAANLWLLRSLALARLPASYAIVGVIAVLILGQFAVLWPALRAARVPPAVATRNV